MTLPLTDRRLLIEIAAATLEALRSSNGFVAFAESSVPSEIPQDQASRDIIANTLSSALDWARMEQEVHPSTQETVDGGVQAEPYIPSNQALSLIQSAYAEYIETSAGGVLEIPFDPADPGWLTIAYEKLKALVRGNHRFIKHSSASSFQYPLGEDAVVAVVGDWGTGQPTAERVMERIRDCKPTHVIHLGDIYYSGTPHEVQTRFLDVIAKHGPAQADCRYFSLNGNHDMYSGGYGYFDSLLPKLGQDASYFNLRNEYWQLVGLDSGYEDYGLQDPQRDWLVAQLDGKSSKSIVLSHHQLFSPYESRAANRTLLKKTAALLPEVFAWFWGHEHKCIILGENMGIKPRCIGHGAIPVTVPYGPAPFPAIPIEKVDERSAPPPDGGGIHGFALLRFAGPNLRISYLDEFGGEFWAESSGF